MKTIEVKCSYCGEPVIKQLREYKRQLKKNQNSRFFCNLSCSKFQNNKENPPSGNISNLVADNRRDLYSPFRYFILRAKSRTKSREKRHFEFNLTLEYLKELWESQNGICPITNQKLILPKGTDGWDEVNPYNASLDRIDNTIGYVIGNVRYISYMANLGRQSFTDNQLVGFCKIVASNNFLYGNQIISIN